MSGMLAGTACPTRATEWMPIDGPADRCTWHHASDQGVVTVWPEPFRRWARASESSVASLSQANDAGASPVAHVAMNQAARHDERGNAPHDGGDAPGVREAAAPRLTIVRPLAGAVFLRDPTLRPEFQALTLESQGGAPGTREWFVNGARVGETDRDGSLRWPMQVGTHAIVVRDPAGGAATARVVVR